jgi:hypothetical protein
VATGWLGAGAVGFTLATGPVTGVEVAIVLGNNRVGTGAVAWGVTTGGGATSAALTLVTTIVYSVASAPVSLDITLTGIVLAPTFRLIRPDSSPDAVETPPTVIVLPVDVGVTAIVVTAFGTVPAYEKVLGEKAGAKARWPNARSDRNTAGGRGVTVNESVEAPTNPLYTDLN